MATVAPVAESSNALVTYAAASAGGDTIALGSAQRCHLVVRNASGSSITVTFTAVSACSQGFLHNTVVMCAVGDTAIAVPRAAVTAAGTAAVTYSATTSVTVAAVTS